jgi:hypothetical protein
MARYEVRCEVEVPDELGATEKQVEDWVRFNLHENGSLGPSPIQNRDFEAVPFSVEVQKIGIQQRLNREKF